MYEFPYKFNIHWELDLALRIHTQCLGTVGTETCLNINFGGIPNSRAHFPYAPPCMEYVPALALKITQMSLNIPYMEHMGIGNKTHFSPRSLHSLMFM